MLRRRPEFHGTTLAVRARVGGLATQLVYAGAHCLAHLTAAVSLLLLLELVGAGAGAFMVGGLCGLGSCAAGRHASSCRKREPRLLLRMQHTIAATLLPPSLLQAMEVLIKHEGVGGDGYHSL